MSITNCNFTDITAPSGGASLYLDLNCPGPQLGVEALYCPTQVSISGSRFTNSNTTLGRGGAAYISAANTRVQDSFFTNNGAALSGGALMFDSAGVNTTLDVVNTVFSGNVAGNVVGPNPPCNVTTPTTQCNVENECGGALRVLTSTIPVGGQRYWSGSVTLTVSDSQFVGNYNDQVNTAGAGQSVHSASG